MGSFVVGSQPPEGVMVVKQQSSVITFILGLLATIALAACGDNIHPPGVQPNPGDSAKEITRFTILGVDGTITGTSIAMTLPFGTDLTALTPTVVITGASVSPASGVAHDFTSAAIYTVTAVDGSTQAYTVSVAVAASSAKDITRFTILGVDGAINGTNISLTLPFGTDLTNLTPTVTITGVSVSPASGAAQSFAAPVTYTVSAADGSTKAYSVTASVAASSAKEITRFTILGVDGAINGTSISLTLPSGTSLAALTPSIAITGVSVSPASGATQSFAAPVTYTVTAADGSTKAYSVSVGVALNSAKDITRFTILGVDGAISGTSISLTLPSGTGLTALTPTIAITGVSVSPASGVAQDFSAPVAYTVTAADGSTKVYTASVSVALSSAKDITQFTILGVDGAISGTSITLTLPSGTSLAALTPSIAITGVSVNPASGVPQSFASPVNYTVTAADGSTKTYVVTVMVAASSAKDITQFTILGVDGAINGTNISLTLPFGTSLAALTPTIAITGVSVSPASGVAQDFSAPVAYTVTAADGSTKTYTVTVGVALSSAKDITQFTILGVDGAINGTSITLTLPFGTSLLSLTPTIAITGVSVSPASGAAHDFTSAVLYTVTAMDGSTKTYTVTVMVAPSSAKDITQFSIAGVNGAINGTSISLTLPFGTSLFSLTPMITITGVSVNPGSGVAQDFSGPVLYTVTAMDGSTKTYTVNVGVAANSSKDITQFTILGVNGAINGTSISLTLPFGTSLASLTPTIAITGTSVSPASGVAQDFSAGPVFYVVTAADGSTKAYSVTVTTALNSAKDITRFTILGVDGTINGTNISLQVPFGTSLASLTPTILITGTSVNPASGAAQSFTSPVTYTVTAADGTTKTYTVTVTAALNNSKDITRFTILGVDGTITGTNISLQVPFGTSLASLTPTILITGTSVSPGSGQAVDFSAGPVTYTVTAADGTMKAYSVSVTAALNSAKDITRFTILGIDGNINNTTITLQVPFGTSLASLTPTILITGNSVSPTSGQAVDFSGGPVTYTVTAADGSTKAYSVTVTAAQNSAKDITKFTILGIDGTITGTNITLQVPFGTSLASLTPTIVITGNSVSPASGTAQDFSSAVTYTVTAADGTTKSYLVTVTVGQNTAKDITAFSILGMSATISGTSITLILPAGTNLTSLTPTITITGTSVSPASGVAQNFTNPVQYTVTAADGSTQVYTATVTAAPNSDKDIIGFKLLGDDAIITGTSITLTLPFGTNLTALVPTVIITGVSVSPASGVAHDFTNPVTYTVTAADGSTKSYTVTVSLATGDDKDIIRFTILGLDGAIATTSPTTGVISLNVPKGTNLTALTPTITITGVSVSPASGVVRDFSNPVTYVVTAANGTTKTYTVTVGTVNGNGTKLITDFIILGVHASITNGISSSTIMLTVPHGTDISALTPTIITNASSVSPPSRVTRNFTNPVTYTATAADGSTRVYTVTVTVAP